MKERARRLREAAREIDKQEKELRRLVKRAEELLRDTAPTVTAEPAPAKRKSSPRAAAVRNRGSADDA
jgi:hypothetical protein